MAVMLFSLRNVPDDEAEEVRALLHSEGIVFYETSGGRWGTAVPALWLEDAAQLTRARALIDHYQTQRARSQQERYAQLQREGKAPRMRDTFRAHPLRFMVYVVVVIGVLYFSTKPFWSLGV